MIEKESKEDKKILEKVKKDLIENNESYRINKIELLEVEIRILQSKYPELTDEERRYYKRLAGDWAYLKINYR